MPSDTASDLRHADADENLYRPSERVLLLAPSRGLGGGIERYIETLEWAFADQKVTSERIDLNRAGLRAHLQMLTDGRTAAACQSETHAVGRWSPGSSASGHPACT